MTNAAYMIDNIFVVPDEIRKETGIEMIHTVHYGKYIHYKDALEIIKGYRFGGYDDWRLPTVAEVLRIFKDIKLIKLIDKSVIKNDIGAYNQRFSWFWTASQENLYDVVSSQLRFRMFNQHDKNGNLKSVDVAFKHTDPIRGNCSFFVVR